MKQFSSRWSVSFERCGLVMRALLLTGALLLTLALVMPVAYNTTGSAGLVAATAALGICLAAGLTALITAEWLGRTQQVVQRVLLGMLLRMGIPLGTCTVFYLQRSKLAEEGIAYYILIFYAVMLLMETMMDVGRLRSETGTRKA